MIDTPTDFFCSELSRDVGEEMAGTAVHAPVWFLLEYNGPWGEKATSDNNLAAPVQDWLKGLEGYGRLQFIKQPGRVQALDVHFYTAVLADPLPRLYKFTAATYEELFALDVAAIIANDPAHTSALYTKPLYLVCSNGRRDRCCALHGVAFAQALAQVAGSTVWQTTHLGGHRFAATLLSLPDGVCYGRLTPADAAEFHTRHQQGRLWLPKMRGRTSYDPITQLAEVMLRRETGQHAHTHYRHQHTSTTANGWEVLFVDEAQRPYTVTLAKAAPLALPASCGSDTIKPIPQYTLLSIRQL